ncbi:MAG: PDZ domain-containing protein [Acidobacteriota bacterium]
MNTSRTFPIVLALLASGLPALAGGKECAASQHAMKCDMSAEECLKHMSTYFKDHGWAGLELDVDATGALTVLRVVPDSPAAAAGIKPGDVLKSINDVAFDNEAEKAKIDMTPGSRVTYTVARDGQDQRIDVTLAKAPESVVAEWIGTHMLEHAEAAKVAQK